jgi:PAS domain S-box-containing protein
VTTPLDVLILEDNPDDAELLASELATAGFAPTWTRVDNSEDFLAALRRGPDVVLADYSLPQFDALAALDMANEHAPEVPVIVVSGVMSEETCVQSLRRGAVDYLLKDRLTRLGPAVAHALAWRTADAARRQAEEEARDSTGILQDIIDAAPAMIYLTDTQGRFLLVNSEFERLWGLDRAAVRGKEAGELPSTGLNDAVHARDQRCLHRGAVIESEEVTGAGDEERTYLSTRYPLRRPDGSVHAVAAIYTDITRHKRVENELRCTRARLQRQAAELARSNAELHELDQLKNQFIATVSHELRTPLTSIRGYTEVLAGIGPEWIRPAEQRMIGIIERNGKRLLDLIEDLLSFAHIENGGTLHLARRSVDLHDLADSCRATIEPSLTAAGLTLACDVPDGLPTVSADPAQLERVLLNLLSNAVKFSPDGGTITLRIRRRDDRIAIAISDHGIGIPLAEQARLFTRFFRSSSAEQLAIRGTGLGLAIVKSLVEAHGGETTVESVPGAGTTVTVLLPLAEAVADHALDAGSTSFAGPQPAA